MYDIFVLIFGIIFSFIGMFFLYKNRDIIENFGDFLMCAIVISAISFIGSAIWPLTLAAAIITVILYGVYIKFFKE